jgi:gluconokinase
VDGVSGASGVSGGDGVSGAGGVSGGVGEASGVGGTGGADRAGASGLPVVVVMGVSGCGKSAVGAALAERLGVPCADADDFHPAANIAKMASGRPLDDADRWPWLDIVAGWIAERGTAGGVVGCSALRRRYRDRLRAGAPGVPLFFLHLDGTEELLTGRLTARTGHFMPASLLRSQLDALEPLGADERGAAIPIDGPLPVVVERAWAALPFRPA